MAIISTHEALRFKWEVLEDLEYIRKKVSENNLLLHQVLSLLKQRQILVSAEIVVMPKQIEVGQTAEATIQGKDQNGSPIVLDSTYKVAYQASDPAGVTFGTPNADGSDTVTGNVAESETISAVITRPDGVQVTATGDTLTIVPQPPVLTSAAVVLQ